LKFLFLSDVQAQSNSFEGRRCLCGALELGDSLGALRHGVLGKLTGKEKTDGSLDLAGRESALLVVAGKTAGLKGESLEDVVDERVQDRHTTLGDTSVGVNLLQHLVDVGAVGFNSLLSSLASGGCLLGGLCGLLANCRGLCHF
jgi:hypothetical protein